MYFILMDWSLLGGELRQRHPSDLLSTVGTSRERNSRAVPLVRGRCCRNSWPTVIDPDYNMTKRLGIKRIYHRILSDYPPNRPTSSTWLHCDVTHLSWTTGVVALPIPSWGPECTRNVVRYAKLCGQLMQEGWFVALKIIHIESPNTINIYEIVFGSIIRRFKHNNNEPYRHWR